MDDEKFLDYDERHPEFYLRFEKVALQLIAQGRNHYSAYSIRDYLRMRTKLDASKDPAVQFVQQFQKGLALSLSRNTLSTRSSFVSAIADNDLQL